jgi:hypothetical protein
MMQSFLQKTDSAGSPRIPLPGSWNEPSSTSGWARGALLAPWRVHRVCVFALQRPARSVAVKGGRPGFPFQFWLRSELESGNGISRFAHPRSPAQVFAHKRLILNRAFAADWRGPCISRGMSAFHMTSWEERRARGKGLARRFSRFVPTCL